MISKDKHFSQPVLPHRLSSSIASVLHSPLLFEQFEEVFSENVVTRTFMFTPHKPNLYTYMFFTMILEVLDMHY